MYPKLNCFDPCDVAYDWHNTDSDNWNRFATEHARKNSCGPMWQQAGCMWLSYVSRSINETREVY